MAGERYSSDDDWYHVSDDEGKYSSDESYVEINSLSSDNDDISNKDNGSGSGSETGTVDDEESYPSDEGLEEDEENSSSGESSLCETNYACNLELQCSKYQDKSVAYKNLRHKFSSFTRFTKLKQQVEIKDIAKDYILPLLPAKTLVRFRSVSKEWDQRIKSPFLAHQQGHFFKELSGFFCQYNDEDPTFITLNNPAYGVPSPSLAFLPMVFNIISSSNGLLLCKWIDDLYYICNPANEEWKALPEPEYYHGLEPATVIAFEPSPLNMEAHYQLICPVTLVDQPVICFEIYSSEMNSWRVSKTVFIGELSFINPGLYIKGMAYWETRSREVLVFDVKNEIYELIPLPCPGGEARHGVLANIHDELCYIGLSKFLGNEYSIKIYGGVDLSLKRMINVNLEPESTSDEIQAYKVLHCADDVVMIAMGSLIYSYSLSRRMIETTSIEGVYDSQAKYFPYVNSLVHVA